MDHLQSNIFIAGQRLNDLTGYSGIEALKREIEQQEELVQSTRAALQKAREDYSDAISQRSGSQREVNELLQRKHAWTPNDLERFTTLYRSDHANEQTESAAQQNLVAVEKRAEDAGAKLSACILARYHEEQIWSDKIRRMSTWGTWGLMGVNILLFFMFQVAVEPWRRKRLVQGFEDKVMEALEKEGSTGSKLANMPVAQLAQPPVTTDVKDSIVEVASQEVPSQDEILFEESTLAANEVAEPLLLHQEHMSNFESIKRWVEEIFSEQQIVIRRVDLTSTALEGLGAGMAVLGVLVLLFRRQ